MRIPCALLIAFALVACGGNGGEGHPQSHDTGGTSPPPASGTGVDTAVGGKAIDPVCLMRVEDISAHEPAVHRNTRYYFCAAGCRQKFVAAPSEQYTGQPGEGCICGTQMANCLCGHCTGKPERCECAEEGLRRAQGGHESHGDHGHEH